MRGWLLWMALGPWAALPSLAGTADDSCPPGTSRLATDDPLEPFRCVAAGEEARPFLPKMGSFRSPPQCPKGTVPVATPGQIQRYRCAAKPRSVEEPELAPKPARETSPRLAARGASPLESSGGFQRYDVRGEFEVDYPKGWHVTDGWKDEIPTLYFELDTGRQGKQVTLVVSKIVKGQYGYLDLETAIAKEKEWQNAVEKPVEKIGGLPARLLSVSHESLSGYVRLGPDAYYTLTYSAPEDLFETFEPAYQRMLDSFRTLRR